MNNLKIAICIPSLGSGGAERVTSILANKLVEHGYDVSIVMLTCLRCVYQLSDKVKIQSLDCDGDSDMPFIKRFVIRLKKIRGAIKAISPDVVISFMSETNIDVCLALSGIKIPVIVSERNDPAVDPSSKIKQLMRKIAYLKPRGFVFQTPDAKSYFSKRIQKKSEIILNPLLGTLPESHQGEREKRIVAVGRLNKQKNFPMLIDAFSKFATVHPEYVLEIYGEGLLEEKIKNYITDKNLDGKVLLKGFCSDVHERINSAAMFVMSSDFEGMPNALLEAMAVGLPCISTDCPCGGPRMLIENGENGLLVPIGDSAKLTEAMTYMAENPDVAKCMAHKATLVKERADVNAITEKWIEMIKSCRER